MRLVQQQQQEYSTYLADFLLRIHASFVLPLPGMT